MREHQLIIQRAELIDRDYKRLELAIPEQLRTLRAGQCVLVRPRQMRVAKVWHPYLRARWYPVHISNRIVTVEVKTRDHFQPGDVIDAIGPVGKPYQFRSALRHVLLLAYDTPPFPLLMAIPRLLGDNVSVTLVLLGTATAYPTHHIPPEVEIIRGGDESDPLDWQNQVTTIGYADQVFAVVSPGDELATFAQVWSVFDKRRADIGKNYLFGVFQSVVPCGVGACDACLVPVRGGAKHACVDGPAFDLAQVKLG